MCFNSPVTNKLNFFSPPLECKIKYHMLMLINKVFSSVSSYSTINRANVFTLFTLVGSGINEALACNMSVFFKDLLSLERLLSAVVSYSVTITLLK